MEVLLGDINAKLGRDYIFKPTTGNDSFHQDSIDNGVRVITCANSKTLSLRARCSCTETFPDSPGPLLMGRLTTRLIAY